MSDKVEVSLKELQAVLSPPGTVIEEPVEEEETSDAEENEESEEAEEGEEVLDEDDAEGEQTDNAEPGEETEEVEEDGGDEGETETEEGDEEPPEGFVSQEAYDKMLDKVDAMALEGINQLTQQPPSVPTTTLEEQQKVVGTDPLVRQPIPNIRKFNLTQDQHDEVMSDPKMLSQLINEATAEAASVGRQQAILDMREERRTVSDSDKMMDKFFKHPKNGDLVRLKNAVKYEAIKIQSLEGIPGEEALAKAADKIREDAVITVALQNANDKGEIKLRRKKGAKVPRFAGKGGSKGKPREVSIKKKKTKEDKFNDELEELVNAGRP